MRTEGDGHADDEQGVEQSQHHQNFTKCYLIKHEISNLSLEERIPPSYPVHET